MKNLFKSIAFAFIAVLMLAPVHEAFAQKAKPIIGISGNPDNYAAKAPLTYIRSVKKAGGVPLVIPITTDKEEIEQILNRIDGLVLTGGEDVGPLRYFGEEPNRNLGEVAPERDDFDVMLVREAVAKGIPVLGICRGEQVMNVAFGGSLYQDIPSQVPNAVQHQQHDTPRYYGIHSISIVKGSLLNRLLGTDSTAVNSYHHQSVKAVAKGFKVTATAKDGVVEAIEKVGNEYVLGVQFHPEGFVSSGNDFFLPIFTHLIEGAQKRMK